MDEFPEPVPELWTIAHQPPYLRDGIERLARHTGGRIELSASELLFHFGSFAPASCVHAKNGRVKRRAMGIDRDDGIALHGDTDGGDGRGWGTGGECLSYSRADQVPHLFGILLGPSVLRG